MADSFGIPQLVDYLTHMGLMYCQCRSRSGDYRTCLPRRQWAMATDRTYSTKRRDTQIDVHSATFRHNNNKEATSMP